jgi:cytochrome c biogenesis protein CcdA
MDNNLQPKPQGIKRVVAMIAVVILLVAMAVVYKFSPSASSFLSDLTAKGQWMLPVITVAAIVDSINPCAFSILLLTIAFLFTLGNTRKSILKVGGVYIFGVFLVYIVIGLGILKTLQLFNTPHFLSKFVALLLIAYGVIELLGEFFPSFPIKLKIPTGAHKIIARLMEKGSLPTAFLLGAVVGMFEFPCTGGPYLMVLALLHDHATYLRGFAYLIYYNLIFVLPLILILLIASDSVLLTKVQDWKKTNNTGMRLYGGLAVVVLGFLILFFN